MLHLGDGEVASPARRLRSPNCSCRAWASL